MNPQSNIKNLQDWNITEEDDLVARVAITHDGKIAYASPAFCRFAHVQLPEIQDAPASKFIRVVNSGIAIKNLAAGDHQIVINGGEEPLSFHFDWLKTPDQTPYLIGSETTAKTQPPAMRGALSIADLICFSDMSDQCMMVTNQAGQIIKANTQFQHILGYTVENLLQLTCADLFTADDFKTSLATDQTLETPMLTKNGETRWMAWRTWERESLKYWLGQDITPLRNKQKALERREKQLTEAESIGRMGHWHWTIGASDMEWSDELYRIFGVDKNTFKPTLQSLNARIHRSDIARLNQGFQRALIEENDYDMEFRILTNTGAVRTIRCEGRCARNAQGEVDALFGIMQDMTERVLYEQELKEAKNIAERAYAARTQFLANMSHELRTPLNAIIGFSEMIERQLLGPIGTTKYLEYISGIRESGEHLLDLISDILDMSKIEAGKYDLTLESLQPSALVKLAVHMMEGRAHEAGVSIITDIQVPESLKIIADRRAVLQILLNLLSNAVKFSKRTTDIKISVLERENHCLFKVIDHGIGIPANKLANITKPFEQVSSSYTRDHQGSGLGLAITKELAELHGGALYIESKLGEGTTATVRLPYTPPKKRSK